MDIGSELKKLRKKSGLTQSQLAEKCNLSKNAIWNYENNKRTPTLKTLNKISEILDVDLSYIISTPPTSITSEIAKKLNKLGLGSEIIKNIDMDEESKLLAFNDFLLSANLPYGIPRYELELLYDHTISFLKFEFFKLGYVEVKNDNNKNKEDD